MQNIYKIKGSVIECYRLENNIKVSDYIKFFDYTICTYTTYQKIIFGECKIDEIYNQFLKDYKISFNVSKVKEQYIVDIINKIKHDVEFSNFDIAIETLKINLNKYDLGNYEPYKSYKKIFEILLKFLETNELDNREITILNLFSYLTRELDILVYYIKYVVSYRNTLDVKSIEKVILNIPSKYNDEILIINLKGRYYMYKKDYSKSLYNFILLKNIYTLNNNIYGLFDVLQSLHGIYHELGNKEKSDYYMNELIANANNNHLSKDTLMSMKFYIAMDYFSVYRFDKAKPWMKQLLDEDLIKCKNLILPYLHLVEKNEYNKDYTLYFQILNEINSLKSKYMKYYKMKFNCAKKHRLINYLINNINPLLNEEHIFEYHILIDELVLLNEKDLAFQIFKNKKEKGYYIYKEWFKF